MLRDLAQNYDAQDPFSQERLDRALAMKSAIYPEDRQKLRKDGVRYTQNECQVHSSQLNARPREIHRPGEENFERCIDESEEN